ncbi:hypothetical protein [Helicobacter trogontum]|uniref:Barstar (barnase inhibitor) domain-containing protein n=1 Tax=Helicobacter trogontum TaxID=50960 RepID=A0A4U8S2V5_9HELI|nr:hypothetical protein [Helicobacter trogontum]TLD80063.1 hypothetical protein LS81_009780 [Helicobacter trogontum]
MPKLYNMQYGIYTIQSESEIPKELIEDKYTFYVKINGKDIKDYEFDYMDITQNAFLFHTKDCVGWRDRYLDWMGDLSWLYYNGKENTGYKNIILVFEHWDEVGKGFFSNGQKLRDKILEDFMEEEGIFSILAIEDEDFIWVDGTPSYIEDYEPAFKVFNIYLIP